MIFSSDDEKRRMLIRKWYRDYGIGNNGGIAPPQALDDWVNFMKTHGVEATWIAVVESGQGEYNRNAFFAHNLSAPK